MNWEFLICIFFLLFVCTPVNPLSWIIEVKGGRKVANRIAKKYNMVNIGQVGNLKGVYEIALNPDEYKKRRKRSANYDQYVSNLLLHDYNVIFAEEQKELKRYKRGFDKNTCCDSFNDPEYKNQWFYKNYLGLDANVYDVWKQGITGRGVVVTILDDGLEHTHDDLKDNWDPAASFDFNSNDMDPMPQQNDDNKHGTRCAGQVAAAANNSKCGVGVAFEASIGGIRMLDGRVTDSIEARSVGFNNNYVEIYSVSWGPDDNGHTIDGPKRYTKRALATGVRTGRYGKGSLFVWASGNGGKNNDDCNLDGYVSSIYTIAISAITSNGLSPWYSESCSCTLGSTYSSGFNSEDHVITTDVKNSCTDDHTGTSAAAPLAAGIIALVLQANKDLTWRDMQHLIVQTSTKGTNDQNWTINGAGHMFHPKFGFGVLDATRMVEAAKNWTTVQDQVKCFAVRSERQKWLTFPPPRRVIPPGKVLTIIMTIKPSFCVNADTSTVLNKLEHVRLVLWMSTTYRGDIMLKLVSPSGTASKILSMRPSDRLGESRSGFKNWSFMSTNFWDEEPYGKWILQITNGNNQAVTPVMTTTRLRRFTLIFHGTEGRSLTVEKELGEEGEENDSKKSADEALDKFAKKEAADETTVKQRRGRSTTEAVDSWSLTAYR